MICEISLARNKIQRTHGEMAMPVKIGRAGARASPLGLSTAAPLRTRVALPKRSGSSQQKRTICRAGRLRSSARLYACFAMKHGCMQRPKRWGGPLPKNTSRYATCTLSLPSSGDEDKVENMLAADVEQVEQAAVGAPGSMPPAYPGGYPPYAYGPPPTAEQMAQYQQMAGVSKQSNSCDARVRQGRKR